MPLNPDERTAALQSPWFKPKLELAPGESKTYGFMDVSITTTAKFKLAGKDYAYEFTLTDGRKWTVNSRSVSAALLAGLYPQGESGDLVPCRFKLTRLATVPKGKAEIAVEKAV